MKWLVIFLLISQRSFGQNDALSGSARAIVDIQNNQLGYYFYGLPTPRFNTWLRLFIEAYNVKILGGGCIVQSKGTSYNHEMDKELIKRFGEDVFTRIDAKVDSLYQMGLGDRNAEFVGGQKAFVKYTYGHLDSTLFQVGNKVPSIIVKITINEAGESGKIEFLRRKNIEGSNSIYDNEILKVMSNMPNWIPAMKNQKATKYNFTFQLRFDKAVRNKYLTPAN